MMSGHATLNYTLTERMILNARICQCPLINESGNCFLSFRRNGLRTMSKRLHRIVAGAT